MTELPVEHGLLFAAALFCIGLVGVLIRRNLIFILMSLELMLNATAFVFVLGGALHGNADGQVMFLMILTLAAAEIAVALALVVHLYRRYRSLDADRLEAMKG
ncbi:NADH-quinone oxidoreductase subunit K [Marinobacterium nitratireducens]|uniref:NADH-quinone oxidoreductase subunit K n=1 Tax=Marinobacterium nitratireducens TaxID=518897 RepID=A0A917Z8U4_9GAMM|nr:NADH-quinone oxidoreductase subunit NuoK [Marinobacterium nitratireducens]GGO78171.1 NADH-quinone oxidoreductase subunit K [Marinobacterium nitratireducens]